MKQDELLVDNVGPIGNTNDGLPETENCLTADSLLITPDGLLYLDEVFQRNGVKTTCGGKPVPTSYNLINRHGKPEETSHFTLNNRRPVFAITTSSGNKIVSTASHMHMVMNSAGHWVWRKTEKIAPGDLLVSIRHHEPLGQYAAITDGELYFAGVLIADGGFTEARVGVTNNDPIVKEQIESQGRIALGVNPHIYEKASPGSNDYHFNSKQNATSFYEKMGWKPGVAKDIFFVYGGQPLIHGTRLCEAQPYGASKLHGTGHDVFWTILQRNGVVPKEVEYDEVPRGRVGYDTREGKFFILADPCINKDKQMVRRIMRDLNLPPKGTAPASLDPHYRCPGCMCKKTEEQLRQEEEDWDF